jgi:hypothetical protein
LGNKGENYVFMDMKLGFSLKNFGHSPAKQEGDSINYFIATDTANPPKEMEFICDALSHEMLEPLKPENVIFPEAQTTAINPTGIWPRVPKDTKVISRFWALVCVAYSDQFGQHRSKFWFRSNQVDISKTIPAIAGSDLRYVPFDGFLLWSAHAD